MPQTCDEHIAYDAFVYAAVWEEVKMMLTLK